MIEKSDDVLKLALAAAALAGGLSVAYHYAIYIPARDREAASKQQLATVEKANLIAAQQADDRRRKQERNAAYRICLSNAQASYSARWQASCKTQASEAAARRNKCLNSGANIEWCQAQYPNEPESHCTLPGGLADDYDASLQKARERCLDEAKADIASFTE